MQNVQITLDLVNWRVDLPYKIFSAMFFFYVIRFHSLPWVLALPKEAGCLNIREIQYFLMGTNVTSIICTYKNESKLRKKNKKKKPK